VIVLADSSKWGVVGLADIAPLAAAHTLITDENLPQAAQRLVEEQVGSLVVVPADVD
jgi:DeoR/GlpR family transcriptional regulator of sugar metabolism